MVPHVFTHNNAPSTYRMEMSNSPAKRPSIFDVAIIVCDDTRLSTDDLRGRSKRAGTVLAREAFYYLAYRLCNVSYPELARAMGGKSHTTALTAAARMKWKIIDGGKTAEWIEHLERLARARTKGDQP